MLADSSASTLIENPRQFTDSWNHVVALAIGSNIGDSCRNIEYALRLLEDPSSHLQSGETGAPNVPPHLVVTDTSFMYQSAPMYVTDQPPFFNCACIVETNVRPLALLRVLKGIEETVGRVPSIRNGPRAIDLDIILYDDSVLDTRPLAERTTLDNLHGQLVVPHPRLCEREFVLRPLFDMIPDYIHPVQRKTIRALLEFLPLSDPPMERVIPFPKYPSSGDTSNKMLSGVPSTSTRWTYPIPTQPAPSNPKPRKTHVMATLNTTPDSFSDGSDHTAPLSAIAYVESSVAAGASIIDIGGYSTKPGAAFVSPEEETSRVVPAVEQIRGHPDASARQVLISVDTFRPEVAKAAVSAGANCINDVHAFSGPNSYPLNLANENMTQMIEVAKDLAVPVVLMHSRGDAGKNKDYREYSYAGENEAPVLEGVKVELGEKVEYLVKHGIRRWFVIVDPGIGFSKTVEGNLELLRNAGRLVSDAEIGSEHLNTKRRNPLFGYPILIGASRKSFLGEILSRGENGRKTTPKERGWATAAAVACAVQQKSLVVRVHDTREMSDVVQVSGAIWS
ncbi:trifunctional dihydropteroate synthetase [Pleurotus ostreatus]|uniref:Trifunctional dihydropteroate synthetase n=1 Tax=Pleurotus ostreatus TaxID=5322 RepID=A0A8H7A3C0_PLEOS|nr:trifunctional dihydropteroate synthetase [Pleurotus ostreatus]KAF7439989.1 trifunctional dihydropteroate synthetase [Pleurotus ostreatus]